MIAVAIIGVLLAIYCAGTRHIETLRSPVAVRGWSTAGLILDGRGVLPLPDLDALPASSPALAEATKLGIEIGEDGRVYGLLRVHHWCGNDPVRQHIARVDLSDLLLYLGEGRPTPDVSPPARHGGSTPPAFSRYGWMVHEFSSFDYWSKDEADKRSRWRQQARANIAIQRARLAAGR
jgi:hypothetical protein